MMRPTMSMMVAILGAALLAGCASRGSEPQAAGMPSTQAVTCSKCQVTWVNVPVQGAKNRIIGYSSHPSMVCPDCKTAVQSFFTTGKFQHTCKTCGDSMELCEGH